jgi:molybdate transport system substrate-binding protein
MMAFRLPMAVFLALALLAAPRAMAASAGEDSITVLAAASLTDAMTAIVHDYETVTGKRVALSFAGSMILAKQIEASAGGDVFISADEVSMDYLDARGLIARQTRIDLLGNALVLIAPSDSPMQLTIAPGFDLAGALMGGRLAVADTATVPAGRYAKDALTALKVWDSVADRLAQGEDVRATLAYVARGETRLGIVYATDARVEPKVRVVGMFPENSHEPIRYPVALTKDAKPGAAPFLAYLKGEKARAAFEKAGFTVIAH